ncbi:hypothetical protein [Asticcacaulis solisilvae]|uniref:hypothetical protein n=1 Tax=Asticcacaulis solisilvae TaxID=1217274 RepID=UPI003FD853EB
MIIRNAGLLALFALAACSQPKATELPKPPQAMDDTFKACKYMQVKGETVAMNGYACGPDFGNVHLVADETLPGFALIEGSGDAMTYRPVVRIFTKAKDAGLDAILPEIRKLSPGPATASCTLQPGGDPLDPDHPRKVFELAPTGAAKAAWEKTVKTGEGDATPPCGPLGVAMDGSRLFEVMADDPTRVSYIDYGSEIQPFDATSLRSVK